MSHGEDVLDNWEEIDEAGLAMTLQTKLQTSEEKPVIKMKLLQRPQSLQDSSSSSPSVAGASPAAPRQITIAKKPSPAEAQPVDGEPVMMVLHKSTNDYDPATYATPTINQTVKILRRPAQAEERRDTNGMKPKQPIKTLKQREQEYAEARLRILGAAKNPEDDKPPSPPLLATPQQHLTNTQPIVSYNNNNNNNIISNPGPGAGPGPGMHRSSSAPKMSQVSAMYNNYNSYFQGPHNPGLNYYYQHAGPPLPPHQQPPPPAMPLHFKQRMPPYVGGGMGGMGGMPAQPPPQSSVNQQQQQQQSWSPVVGGSVSAALLRQQSMQQSPQQQQHQHQPPPQSYNDNVLRLPRGPCPNGSVGFQMRR